jgi:predicted nucleotidyltransferase
MERREQIMAWLKAILNKNLSGFAYKAFIFGSQANLTVLRRSDIDIGIMAENKIPDPIMAKIFAEIEELPMLFNIDVVDFNEVDEKFKSVALQNIEQL